MSAKTEAEKNLERVAAVEAVIGHILDRAMENPSGFIHVTPSPSNDAAIFQLQQHGLLISCREGQNIHKVRGERCDITAHWYQLTESGFSDASRRDQLKMLWHQITVTAIETFAKESHRELTASVDPTVHPKKAILSCYKRVASDRSWKKINWLDVGFTILMVMCGTVVVSLCFVLFAMAWTTIHK